MLAEFEAARGCGDDDPHVTTVRRLDAAWRPSYAPFPEALDPRLRQALRRAGIEQLYTHQAEAIAHALGGPQRRHRHADGVGQDALLQRAGPAEHPRRIRRRARCICFRRRRSRRTSSPSCTRWRSSSAREGGGEIGVFTYDGDTPQDARRAIRGARARRAEQSGHGALRASCRTIRAGRSSSRICSSSSSTSCTRYRGVFGSHLANIMRRLQRVCRHYGSIPTFICSSATIANPRELAERLTGAAVRARRQERRAARREVLSLRQSAGRQRAARHPAVVSGRNAPRRDRVPEARPAAHRLRAEPAVDGDPDDLPEGRVSGAARARPIVIRGYRGGYLPLRRREIERGLRSGEVRCVVSTNALELGIDIGALDVAVMAGLSGHDRRHLAARRPRRPPIGPIGGRARRLERADRSVRRPASRLFLRRVARARARQSRQPAHPARSREVRGVRAAVRGRRAVRRRSTCRRSSTVLAEEGFVHLVGRAVAVDAGVVSGRRRQPAVRDVGQLRRRRHDATASA